MQAHVSIHALIFTATNS
uniref:Uncharacterized protein n=1 Tax=Anguilla anguilla TaxID=7936 RepID=A0A0E9RNN0_ANGAN